MAKVNHPNMVHVYDHNGRIDFVHRDGINTLWLFARLHRQTYGVLNKAQAVGVCLDVAKALQKQNELGIIHRDIKPDNILLSPQGAK